jgi:hypothetical protein
MFLVLVAVFFLTFSALCVHLTRKADAASLIGASVTLSNSRMSFKAPINSGSAGSTLVTISGAAPDTTTNHLFPGDAVCFTDAGNNVCRDNMTYTVSSVPTTSTFELTTPLTTALTNTDYAVATQAGTWTIAFTTVNTVPIGGKLIITIPMADNASGNNGIPDGAATLATGGFDLNKEASTSATVSLVSGTCPAANWGTAVITPGYGTTDSTITWTRVTSTCNGGAQLSVSIAAPPGIENPAPVTGHAQGTADIYGITIATNDGTNTIDSAAPRVAPVEAVLISGTVDETLAFQVQGLSSGSTYCGNQASVSATATSIPWGHPVTNFFVYAAQQLTLSTNAASGYSVLLDESDQMGKNGNVCTGTTPSPGIYTFGAGTCIRDTLCGASACSETAATDWTSPTGYPGLGYSLASQSGTDAPFFWSEKTRIWSAKSLADRHDGEASQPIMGNSGPVSGNSIYVCYKIAIPGTQPAGYYYNIVRYTATATF